MSTRRSAITRRDAVWRCGVLAAPIFTARAQTASAWHERAVTAPEPLAQVRAAESDGWIAVGRSGGLWWLRSDAPAQRLASGIDPDTPVAAAHGRVVARRSDGRLWIGENNTQAMSSQPVAAHAGCAVLPLGIIAVQGDGTAARLVRLEPGAGGAWQAIATSREPVLADAQPLQVDLDGSDSGHIAVLAGPDAARYRHGVLGDAIEATRVLYLERHDLSPLRELTLPAPHVFEDNRLRVWRGSDGRGAALLVAVRSGPQGAQLALIESDRSKAAALRIAALGEPIGSANRWMSPSTDGKHLVSVHTPHLSGALHAVRRDGERLTSSALAEGVSNHAIGARELDVSAWLSSRYVIADLSSRKRLRSIDVSAKREFAPLELAAPLRAISADAQRRALACVLADGSLRVIAPA